MAQAAATKNGVSRWVLDSYALLAYYQDEPGAARVEQLLADREHRHWMSVVNLGEVFYKLLRVNPKMTMPVFMEKIVKLPVVLVDAERSLALAAGYLKARYPMAYADCFAAALGQRLDAMVITGDPEFEQLEQAGLITVEWLPRARR
jgi:ribonuclease VapC